jgi:hypothetical protein
MSVVSRAVTAADPTLTVDKVTEWWDAVPAGWKLAVMTLAIVLVVVGLVKRIALLTFFAALVGFGLLAWWWWSTRR